MKTNRRSIWPTLLCALVALAAPDPAESRGLFATKIQANLSVAFSETNSVTEVPDLFEPVSLVAVIIGYDPTTDPFSAALDMRGLPVAISWQPAPGALTLNVLGEQVTFTQATLDAAIDDLDAWIHGTLLVPAATLSLTDLLRGLVAQSPVDPVAGNPNSLQSRLFQSDFRLGTEGPFTSGDSPSGGLGHHFGVGAGFGYARGGAFGVAALDLPLDYRLDLPSPKWSLLFSLPLAATFTEGQWSVLASAGAGFQYRPFEWWSITPMARIGGAGSLDLGALGFLYSLSVTSHVRHEWRGITFTMGNLVGFTQSVDGIEIAGWNVTYDLTNPLITNGLSMSGDTAWKIFGRSVGWRLFGHNTQIFGDEVYMDSQTELGGTLGLISSFRDAPYYGASLDLSYVFGNGAYDGLSLKLRARF